MSRSSVTYARATSGARSRRAVDGLRHDLDERDAGPVVVDEGVVGAVDAAGGPADVQLLAGVLLEVHPLDRRRGIRRRPTRRRASRRCTAARRTARSGSPSACPDRSSSSGRIGTTRRCCSPARARCGSSLDGRPVGHRQRAGQAKADRAHLGVGLGAERRRTAAEHLRAGAELDVRLQADDRLVRLQRLVVRDQQTDSHAPSSTESSWNDRQVMIAPVTTAAA